MTATEATGSTSERFAGVYLLDAPYSIDREYDYRLPEGVEPRAGDFLSVPFGNANRRALALCGSIKEKTRLSPKKLKPVSAVMRGVSLDAEMLALVRFMKEQTLCTTGDAVRAILPPAVLSKLTEFFSINPAKASPSTQYLSELDAEVLMTYSFIRERGRVSASALTSRFGVRALEHAIALSSSRSPLLLRELAPLPADGRPPERRVCEPALPIPELRRILDKEHETIKCPASAIQVAILESLIAADGGVPEERLCDRLGDCRTRIAALEKKGLVRRVICDDTPDEPWYSECDKPFSPPEPMRLNEEQTAAHEELMSLIDDGRPHGALLYGVTGSGKTAVMLSLIDKLLVRERGVILLVPEIALTPQTVKIFRTRYGRRVAVLHSGLTRRERYFEWERIRAGYAPLVVGTRSAVFAPVPRLGMIVIDEEQEHTYKSDMSPRYHARDIARFRCASNSALMLLCSATPSVESFKKATDGVYTLVRLDHRYGGARLPEVTIADMRGEVRRANLSPIGEVLAQKLRAVYERGEQSVLFLNRRGYNNFVSCVSCGEAVRCSRCSVSMTYHTRGKNYDAGELVCHWCGRRMPLPETCPNCGSKHLIRMGYGTQRVEQELQMLIPGVRVIRMDTDTTSTREAYDRLLGRFRAHEADILLGTQMVTKGHDFPDVTLVGVLMADMSLYLDDYRASERTFAMLTQVIGRAGRADKPGEAVIQTNNPDHDVIKLACRQDYDTFFEHEIRLRRALTFPPFCDIALLTVVSSDERAVQMAGKLLCELLHELSLKHRDVPMIIFGPFEAPVYRVDGKYRIRLIVKCKLCGKTRAIFTLLRDEFTEKTGRGPTLSVDLDPTSI